LFATVKRSGTPSDVFKASQTVLSPKGEQQAWQVAERARTLGITHVITSDLGRTQRRRASSQMPAAVTSCLSRACASWIWACWKTPYRYADEEEEGWRRTLVNGTEDGRIPEGESMQELSVCMPRWRNV
jgi:probable phosphoglycerate mutase